MKPSPNAPVGATGRPRPPHPHPDEGPAPQVPGAPSSDSARAAAPLADILAWGHGANRFDIAGVPGSILSGIRGDLDVLIGFVAQNEMAGREVVASALFRLRRRLDVAYELFALVARPAWEAANDVDPRSSAVTFYELHADPRR
jgi:hypothetical protein